MGSVLNNFRNPRIVFAFLYDSAVAAVSFYLAFALRFDSLNLSAYPTVQFKTAFFISQLSLLFGFFVNGLYRGVWRFSSTYDLVRVIKASLTGILVSMAINFFWARLEAIPRSVLLIQFLLLVVGLGGGRFIYRFFKDQTHYLKKKANSIDQMKKVLIVGAGRAGEKLVRDINSTPVLNLKVVGFVDDDRYKKNAVIHNIRVLGDTSAIPTLIADHGVDKVFIAIPSASGEDVKRIVKSCEQTGVELKILPKMDHFLSSQVELSLLRNIKIEDLLGREEVQLDTTNLNAMINDKVIMVTGAGGSIGSELCMQIAKFSPRLIVMVDSCELFMYELEMKFKELYPEVDFFPKMLDVRNALKVEAVFAHFRPQIVLHAAAYKHVPMMEYNPFEAIETNVRGTQIVAEASMRHYVEKFIMISTDKAVNPTNVMGASKRVAEMVISDLSTQPSKTKFISVRFGNVLGSNGSVIPLFKKQIEARKDITVTHPEITRYFMSIPEASQLVLQAGSMGRGGEVFVLDMGVPVKIVDLAKEMIRLVGLTLDKDIKIVFTGLRPGEKLYEELFSEHESLQLTHHGKIRLALFRTLPADFREKLNRLINLKVQENDTIIYLIKEIVPEFEHFKLVVDAEKQLIEDLS